ncbi:MAG TPA: DoxX family protein [Gemmatimonadaceae bacterium]|nr:DoxX family protein [Gemmatimonadaceae bacterium]
MILFRPPSPRQTDIGLTILRVILGVVFLAHGWQKLFVMGLPGVTGGFAQMGIPMPGITAPFITLLELFGGIALIVGLLTRLTAFGFAVAMLVATLLVHMKNGFFAPKGIEFTLVLMAGALAIMLAGPGAYSLDALIGRRSRVAIS